MWLVKVTETEKSGDLSKDIQLVNGMASSTAHIFLTGFTIESRP